MRIYLLIGWSVLFLIFMIVISVLLYKNIKKSVIAARKDDKFIVRCSECGKEHDITIEELVKVSMTKKKTYSISVMGNRVTNYRYFSKKMSCPYCEKKTYNEVLNYNDYKNGNLEIALPAIGKFFVTLGIGGCIFIIIGNFLF